MKKFFILSIVAFGMLACVQPNYPDFLTDYNYNNNNNYLSETYVYTEGGKDIVIEVHTSDTWSAYADKSWVSINPDRGQGGDKAIIHVEKGRKDTAKVNFESQNWNATLTIERYYMKSKDGTLPGKFSVSRNRKVCFSQGKLAYNRRNNTWYFLESQIYNSGSHAYYSDNNEITYFGWGTGANPTNTSNENRSYSSFVDWGDNKISNGGNKANQWYTMPDYEWHYLLHERANAEQLIGFGTIDNFYTGLILLPDNWDTPEDLHFVNSTSKGLSWNGDYYENSNNDNYSHNSYTKKEWEEMEAEGAVFLPNTGYYQADSYSFQNIWSFRKYGYYWTRSRANETYPYFLFFSEKELETRSTIMPSSGLSVRLVQEVE